MGENDIDKPVQAVFSMASLVDELNHKEYEYKRKKFDNESKFNDLLINTDWDDLNKERKEKGLPKLGNQDMKIAYLKEKSMGVDLEEELSLELKYKELRRKYEVALKYSFDILR